MIEDTIKQIEALRKSELENPPLKTTSESLLQKIQQFEEAQLIENSVAVFTEQTRNTSEDAETKLKHADESYKNAEQARIASVALVKKVTESENTLKIALENLDKVNKELVRLQKYRDEIKTKLDANPADAQLNKDFENANTEVNKQYELVNSATTNLDDAKAAKETADKELKTAIDNEFDALTEAKKAREEFEAAANRFSQLKAGMEALNSRIKFGSFSTLFDKITSPGAISGFYVLLCAVALLGLYFLLKGDFLDKIQNIDVARGLITTTISIVSVAMAMVLVLYPITGSDKENLSLKDRFMLSKEVLTMFVGILGTIVGFHYGSDHGSTGSVSETFIVSPNEVQAGSPVTLVSVLTHGTPPYTYEVSSEPNGIEKKGEILDNVINLQVNAPADIKADTAYKITLTAKDSNDTEIAKLKRLVMVKKPPTAPDGGGNSQPNGPSEINPELKLKVESIKQGENLELEGKIAPGGTYRIKTDPSLKIGTNGSGITANKTSADGNINESFTLPEDITSTKYTITLELLGTDGKTAIKSVSKLLTVTNK
ncbi:hypothetical protein [Methylomonas sp. 11b]|uniref:hypothetical protein n=1 Tax=Methylomonas sp. 11b TaxID=1168169 RepID=UPI00047EB780|nr:hypothetical protein [Methylomonas sp. 11b]